MTAKTPIDIDELPDADILGLRFCDLDLKIEGTDVESRLEIFYKELDGKGIRFRPKVYLTDEWLCPEGVPAIGVPFYLCHPRLMTLERQMMLEVEGESLDEFLKLMRHEMGHALSYAYKFQQKPKWRKIFGTPSKEFSDYYKYKKYSRSYVSNIGDGYAQSHPDEDFAETFAVWMNPAVRWEEKYKGWSVITKLEYVDTLMRQIKDKEPMTRSHTQYFNIKTLKSKLGTHYKKRKKLYAHEYPDFFDAELLRLFSRDKSEAALSASQFLMARKKELIQVTERWTGQRKYVMDHIVKIFIARSKVLGLFTRYPATISFGMCVSCLTALVKNHFYTGLFKRDL